MMQKLIKISIKKMVSMHELTMKRTLALVSSIATWTGATNATNTMEVIVIMSHFCRTTLCSGLMTKQSCAAVVMPAVFKAACTDRRDFSFVPERFRSNVLDMLLQGCTTSLDLILGHHSTTGPALPLTAAGSSGEPVIFSIEEKAWSAPEWSLCGAWVCRSPNSVGLSTTASKPEPLSVAPVGVCVARGVLVVDASRLSSMDSEVCITIPVCCSTMSNRERGLDETGGGGGGHVSRSWGSRSLSTVKTCDMLESSWSSTSLPRFIEMTARGLFGTLPPAAS
mmetsp:Transcript_104032/g.333450  ORF Transcript_104032/g.333450 Transcript_104032/m.333450 type:complete len:281 (-) Transcript_104032:235-1077(-)